MPQRPPASGQKDHEAECKTRAPWNTAFHPRYFLNGSGRHRTVKVLVWCANRTVTMAGESLPCLLAAVIRTI